MRLILTDMASLEGSLHGMAGFTILIAWVLDPTVRDDELWPETGNNKCSNIPYKNSIRHQPGSLSISDMLLSHSTVLC